MSPGASAGSPGTRSGGGVAAAAAYGLAPVHPEPDDLEHAAGGHPEGVGIDLPVHDAGPVRGVEAGGGLPDQVAHLDDGQAAARGQLLAQAEPGQVLHDEERRPVVLSDVQDHGDVGVDDLGDGLGVLPEHLTGGRAGRSGAEHLDGHDPVGPRVVPPPHLAHRAAADALVEPVPAGDQGGRALRVGHIPAKYLEIRIIRISDLP
ncbi:hypothetical protein GCM10020001_082130 [Nonomuraea salmonea]